MYWDTSEEKKNVCDSDSECDQSEIVNILLLNDDGFCANNTFLKHIDTISGGFFSPILFCVINKYNE